jgi:hypothetical protein
MPDGQVVDAIPGLYGPKACLKQIARGEALVRLLADTTLERRNAMLADYHQQQAEEVTKAWLADWQRAERAMASKRSAAEEMEKMAAEIRAAELKSRYNPPPQAPQQQVRAPAVEAPRAEAATRIASPRPWKPASSRR